GADRNCAAVHQYDSPFHFFLEVFPLHYAKHEEENNRQDRNGRHSQLQTEKYPARDGTDHEKPKKLFFHQRTAEVADLFFDSGVPFRDGLYVDGEKSRQKEIAETE